jgi:hypothetical protein
MQRSPEARSAAVSFAMSAGGAEVSVGVWSAGVLDIETPLEFMGAWKKDVDEVSTSFSLEVLVLVLVLLRFDFETNRHTIYI